jgi:hypothetical protein
MVCEDGVIVTVGAETLHGGGVVYVMVILILSILAVSLEEEDPFAEIATPKLEALMSETVQVVPHKSVVDPYDAEASDVGQFVVVLACSVPVIDPALTILMLLSRIYLEELTPPSLRSIET